MRYLGNLGINKDTITSLVIKMGIRANIPYANFTADRCKDIADILDAFFAIA